MDEVPQQPAPSPSEPPHHDHLAGPRRQKRRLMLGVAMLYAASLAAACFLVIQGRALRNTVKEAAETSGSTGILNRFASNNQPVVGWVSIRGPIYSSESGKPWERGAEQWARKIKAMAEAKNVKAIVLDINSPGGSVGAVQELYSQILRVKREKHIPFVAVFDDVAASGGYYIAAACDQIVAHPGTLTGSIGVIFETTNLQGLFSKIGLKMDPIKSGAHKDIGSPARPMTPEERKIMQDLIDDAYGQFLTAVATGRHLDVAVVKPLADGRIFSGDQALSNHLVDKLGDSTDAVELAAQLAHIPGKPKVKRDGNNFSDIFEMMDSRFDGVLSAKAPAWLSAMKPPTGLLYMWEGGY